MAGWGGGAVRSLAKGPSVGDCVILALLAARLSAAGLQRMLRPSIK